MPDITSLFEGEDGVSRTLFNQKLSDINAHGNDATKHVTEVEREAWNKKANGNNAVWVATSATTDGSTGIVLTIPNFVFTEGCQITFKSPNNAQPYDYAGVTINQSGYYAIRSSTFEILTGDEWKVNALVTLSLSSTKVMTDSLFVGAAFFKSAGGSLGGLLNFPLIISETEPTSPKTGTIWVLHNNPTDFKHIYIDDHVSVNYGEGSLILVINNTNDGTDIFTENKMVSGTRMLVTSKRQSITGNDSYWYIASSNKGNISYNIKRNYPRVYSRLNGTLDMESAFVFDGGVWKAISQKGAFFALSFSNGSSYLTSIYSRIGTQFELLPSLGVNGSANSFSSNGISCVIGGRYFDRKGIEFNQVSSQFFSGKVSLSSDGTYIGAGDGLYKRNDKSFTKILNSGQSFMTFITDDGMYAYSAVNGTSSSSITLYKQQLDGTFKSIQTVTFNMMEDPDNIVFGNNCAYIRRWTRPRSGGDIYSDIILRLQDDKFIEVGRTENTSYNNPNGRGAAFSPNGEYFAYSRGGYSYYLLKWNSSKNVYEYLKSVSMGGYAWYDPAITNSGDFIGSINYSSYKATVVQTLSDSIIFTTNSINTDYKYSGQLAFLN